MTTTDLLVVGPAGYDTGGIARYIAEQRRQLPDDVAVTVHDTSVPEGSGRAWFLVGVIASLYDAARYLLRSPPSVVHVHSSQGLSFLRKSFYVFVSSLVWRRPVVLHVHGPTFDEFVADASLPVGLYQRAVFAASDVVIVLSEYWRRVLESSVDSADLVVLPNAVDPSEYTPRYGVHPPGVAFISNHVSRKGVREFVDAIDALQADDDLEFHVTIAGTGPLAHHAERLADRHDDVEYCGYVSEERKRSILDESSIYVLPTHSEGLPIAILEGMAGGNAVVSTAVGAIPDVLDDENGVVVEPGDADALEAGLRKLLVRPDRVETMGRTNRETVCECYTWSRISSDLTRLYNRLS